MKSIKFIMTLIAITFSASFFTVPAYAKDESGNYELADAQKVLKAALGIAELDNDTSFEMDFDSSGDITLSDAQTTLKVALGIVALNDTKIEKYIAAYYKINAATSLEDIYALLGKSQYFLYASHIEYTFEDIEMTLRIDFNNKWNFILTKSYFAEGYNAIPVTTTERACRNVWVGDSNDSVMDSLGDGYKIISEYSMYDYDGSEIPGMFTYAWSYLNSQGVKTNIAITFGGDEVRGIIQDYLGGTK